MTTPFGYQQALEAIEARGYGIKPGLERMRQLTDLLDNPQLTYPTVHIAGTNGKTSIARMLGAILAGHGLKTGVYTSPHLHELRERFVLTGLEEGRLVSTLISKSDFAAIYQYLTPFLDMVETTTAEAETDDETEQAVTYFELTTLMAFEWMAEKAVAAGVYEAGMGGRWDATNVLSSSVAVLSSIGLDHVGFLGSTSVAQAREKAGIIKPGAAVVSARQKPEVLEVIEQEAASREASLQVLGREFRIESDEPAVHGRVVSVSTARSSYREVYLPLFGPHQAENLAVAIAGAEAFRDRPLDEPALKLAIESSSVPGRLEVAGRKPLVLLDGAHNEAAAEALAKAIRESFATLSVTMVVSIFKDKDASAVLGHLVPLARRLILSRSSSPRAADPQDLAGMVPASGPRAEVIEPLSRAVDEAVASAPEDEMVLITGSLYAVGEARAHLLAPARDQEH